MLTKPFRCLLIIGSLIFLSTINSYATSLSVEIKSNIAAQPLSGIVILDFIDGDGFSNSSATITNTSVAPYLLEGSASEIQLGEYFVTDTALLSSLYFAISDIYIGFSFDVDATLYDPGMLGFPDSLVLTMTDTSFNPLFLTSDPRGTNALIVLSTLDQEVYPPEGFEILTTTQLVTTPEPGAIWLLGLGIFLLFVRKKSSWTSLLFLAMLIFPTFSEAALSNVTNQVTIERSALVYDRTTKTYDGLITITNVGPGNLGSPIYLVIKGMPDSVSVYNATNLSSAGDPMLNLVTDPNGLSQGGKIKNFKIKFHNPNSLKFTAVFSVLSNDGSLPPDPGPSGQQTLAGIDSNLNGIRDDIEIYIAVNFGGSKKIKEALNQVAQALQQGVLSTNDQDSMLSANAFSRAMECLEYIDPNDESWKSVQSQAINTEDRLDAWLEHEQRLSGKVFPARPQTDWRNSCLCNPDTLEN